MRKAQEMPCHPAKPFTGRIRKCQVKLMSNAVKRKSLSEMMRKTNGK